ncbi:MAG TPA: hypothetical protein PLY35_12445, partial [Thermotogota bacterium]|nr:hypothetical protein [Thermotogota bacterium]
DLVLQKMIRVTPETHARVMQVIAEIQARTKVNTSADIAVRVLLEGWKELERISKGDIVIITSERMVDRGEVVTPFLEEHFGTQELEL